jgi:hypothetical protein
MHRIFGQMIQPFLISGIRLDAGFDLPDVFLKPLLL